MSATPEQVTQLRTMHPTTHAVAAFGASLDAGKLQREMRTAYKALRALAQGKDPVRVAQHLSTFNQFWASFLVLRALDRMRQDKACDVLARRLFGSREGFMLAVRVSDLDNTTKMLLAYLNRFDCARIDGEHAMRELDWTREQLQHAVDTATQEGWIMWKGDTDRFRVVAPNMIYHTPEDRT